MALDTTVGGASADSYATLAEYQAYGAAYGWSLSGVDATDEVNLRNARRALDTLYVWKGQRVTSMQLLEWPRSITGYIDGFPVSTDAIPQAIKDAQCELAYLIQGGATPDATIENGAIQSKREKVDVIEEETVYARSRERQAYPIVDGLVAPYARMKRGARAASIGLMRA